MQNTIQTISATELARNTRQILDQVVAQGATLVIERNHALIAQIGPSQRTMTASQALAGLALPVGMTPVQANAWLNDSKKMFSDEVRDPWA